MIRRWMLILLVALVVLASCRQDDDEERVEQTTPYYPLSIGNVHTYEIIEYTIMPVDNHIDTSHYYQREEVVSTTDDSIVGRYYLIDISRRATPSDDWRYQYTERARIENDEVILQKGNLKYVKLILPPAVNKEWNPLKYIDVGEKIDVGGARMEYFKGWKSTVTDADDVYANGDISYTKVLTVSHADRTNRIEKRSVIEKYMSGVGLVYSSREIFDTQCFEQCTDDWLVKANKGHRIIQKLIQYKGS